MDLRTKQTIEAYDKIAPKYATTNRMFHFWKDELDELHRQIHGNRVLEIGCGGGRDAHDLLQAGFDYIGTDASKGLLALAQKLNPKGTFKKMSFYDLRFPAHQFDAVWSIATLLHIPKRRLPKVLRSIRRLLTPQGMFVVSMKEKSNVDEQVITQEKYGGVTRFFAFYSKNEFRNILREHGFRVIKQFQKSEGGNNWMSFVCTVSPAKYTKRSTKRRK